MRLSVALLVFAGSPCLVWAQLPKVVRLGPPQYAPWDDYDMQDPCKVEASVRAQDLHPNGIANGDLRVRVNQACAEKIATVSLQLQLDEYSEVKYLKEGATLPKLPDCRNGCSYNPALFDSDELTKYEDALHDPALWILNAEERTAWKSSVRLIDGPFDYSRPVVVPFLVAMPNVNYPPGQHAAPSSNCESMITDGAHSYHYTAIVTFSSGRIVEVPAGYTTFVPTPASLSPATTFVSSVPFRDEDCDREHNDCIFDQLFAAEVTLESGNVVTQGDTIYGRVTVHNLFNGSSTAKTLSVDVRSEWNSHWAKTKAASGAASSSQNSCFNAFSHGSEISTTNCEYAYISGDDWEDDRCETGRARTYQRSKLNKEEPHLDFSVKVGEHQVRNFRAYYIAFETSLVLELGVLHAPEVQRCPVVDGADLFEESLWDPYVPLDWGGSASDESTHTLIARIPITVIGSQSSQANAFTNSLPVHYLTPGAPSPLMLARPPVPGKDIVFPALPPVITPESMVNTTQRKWPKDGVEPMRNYFLGAYAGILWQKKIIMESRTHPPCAASDAEEGQRYKIFW